VNKAGDKVVYIDFNQNRCGAVVWSRGSKPGSLWVIPDESTRRYVLIAKRRELYREIAE